MVETLDAQLEIVPSGHPAAREMVHELVEYLTRRYPHLYTGARHDPSTTAEGGWYEGRIRLITLNSVGQTSRPQS